MKKRLLIMLLATATMLSACTIPPKKINDEPQREVNIEDIKLPFATVAPEKPDMGLNDTYDGADDGELINMNKEETDEEVSEEIEDADVESDSNQEDRTESREDTQVQNIEEIEVITDQSLDDESASSVDSLKDTPVSWNTNWEYADFSKINSGTAMLYRSSTSDRKNITVAVNAGHGTSGGASVYTQCHPDGSAKVTGGSTAKGSTTATAINMGCTLNDGTKEAVAVLDLAVKVKEVLLNNGFDVLMLRESDDQQLDNIARTVMANNNADCHISLHYDATGSDKGFFYIRVPNVTSYKEMEPVASHWEEHDKLGENIISGTEENGIDIYGSGSIALDLTQTSYSTIPSVDLEVGDKASDHSEERHEQIAEGIVKGIEKYFA